jgi:alcohol dehydrogenase class IV
VAVILTGPAGLRLTAPVLPARHRRAAELLTGAPVDPDDLDALPRALEQLIADVGAPARLSELGFGNDDVPALVEGALKQQRLLAVAPLEVGAAELDMVFRQSL